MSQPSIKSFLLPSILILSLTSLGISIYQVSRPTPSVIKYVDSKRIWQPVFEEMKKTLNEYMAPRLKEKDVLKEKINSLEQKKKVKNYLGTAEAKELKDKQQRLKELDNTINRESHDQFQKMFQSKQDKIHEVMKKIAEKNHYTIQPLGSTNELITITICKKDDVTDFVLAELGIAKATKV